MMNKKFDKILSHTLLYLEETLKNQSYIAKVNSKTAHSFNGRDFECSHDGQRINFHASTLVRSGLQTHKEIKLRNETEIKFVNAERELFVKGKYLLPSSISFDDSDINEPKKLIKGTFTCLSTKNYRFYSNPRFFRLLLPLPDRFYNRGDFTGFGYRIDGKPQSETLLCLKINGIDFHFYPFSSDGSQYLAVDACEKMDKTAFLAHCNSILLTYAFIKGKYYGEQAYILSYKSTDFTEPLSLETMLLGGGIYNGFPIHTSSPYSILAQNKDTKYLKDANGKITGIDDRGYRKYMVEFPSESFEKLAEMICNKGGVLRTVILLVSNASATLEIKVPTLFVALENITRVLGGQDNSPPQLIEDDAVVKQLKVIIKTAAKEVTAIEKAAMPKGLNAEELKEFRSNYERIRTKLHSFNNGTNNKKLIEPFLQFGYELSTEEEDLIYKERNKFLHGQDFMSLASGYEMEFRELFHISLRLQKLIAVLLLKSSGFEGYIINNPKLYEYITGKKLREKYFQHI